MLQVEIAELITRGVSSLVLTAVGYGAARLVAENETEEGRQHNYRIEFIDKQ